MTCAQPHEVTIDIPSSTAVHRMCPASRDQGVRLSVCGVSPNAAQLLTTTATADYVGIDANGPSAPTSA